MVYVPGFGHITCFSQAEILKQMQVKDCHSKKSKAKWSWVGHLIRREENRQTKRQPRNGKTNQGRNAGGMVK